MSSKASQAKLAPVVRQTLNEVRRLLRRYLVLQTCLTIACIVLLLFWFGGLVDFLPVTMGANETPVWVRMALLVAMGLGSLWTIFVWATPRWFARIPDRSLALLLEKKNPHLANHLVTAVELSERRGVPDSDFPSDEISNPAAYSAMLENVHKQLPGMLRDIDVAALFDWRPVWSAIISVALSLAITLISWLAMPSWMSHWCQRLFALSEQPWPRRAELRADGVQIQLPAFSGQLTADRKLIEFEQGVLRLTRGAAAQLLISAQAEGKIVPEVCTVFYHMQDGTRGRANMRRLGKKNQGWQPFVLDGPPFDGLAQSLDLRVVGLDASLRDLEVDLVDAPIVSDTKLELVYPNYLLESLTRPAREIVPFRSGLQIPEGTQVYLIGMANSDLSQVEYVVKDQDQALQAESLAVQSVVPEGNRFQVDLGVLRRSQIVEARLIDKFGLSSEQVTRFLISVQADETPEVDSRLAGIGNAITPQAVLPLRGQIEDDHAVQAVQVDLQASDSNSLVVDLPVPDDIDLAAEIDLRLLAEQEQFVLEPGTTLGIQVTARDYFDLQEEAHEGKGQPKQLAVVTDDELLVILDRKELELRQRLEQIMLELEQLKTTLQQLGQMEAASAMNILREQRMGLVSLALPQEDLAKQRRMLVLRAQQAVLQGDKSEQELIGIATNVEDLRLQLANNRIDSYDRQQRLLNKVYQPLNEMLAKEYEALAGSLLELQTASQSGQASDQAIQAETAVQTVLDRLENIKEDMLDIESFNEIIDLVRGLLEDQEELLKDTESTQRQRILDLLK